MLVFSCHFLVVVGTNSLIRQHMVWSIWQSKNTAAKTENPVQRLAIVNILGVGPNFVTFSGLKWLLVSSTLAFFYLADVIACILLFNSNLYWSGLES